MAAVGDALADESDENEFNQRLRGVVIDWRRHTKSLACRAPVVCVPPSRMSYDLPIIPLIFDALTKINKASEYLMTAVDNYCFPIFLPDILVAVDICSIFFLFVFFFFYYFFFFLFQKGKINENKSAICDFRWKNPLPPLRFDLDSSFTTDRLFKNKNQIIIFFGWKCILFILFSFLTSCGRLVSKTPMPTHSLTATHSRFSVSTCDGMAQIETLLIVERQNRFVRRLLNYQVNAPRVCVCVCGITGKCFPLSLSVGDRKSVV